MNRRRFLGTGVALTAGLGGCLDVLERNGSSNGITEQQVVETTETFYRAAARGDIASANSLVHPDAVDDGFSEGEARRLQRANVVLHDVEYHFTVSGSGPLGHVALVDMEFNPESSTPYRHEFSIELRADDGDPRVHSGESDRFDQPGPPQVDWELSRRDGGDDQFWLEFRNTGGDRVRTVELSMLVGGRLKAFTEPDELPEDTVIRTIFDETSTQSSATDVTLQWRSSGDPYRDWSERPPAHPLVSATIDEPAPEFQQLELITPESTA